MMNSIIKKTCVTIALASLIACSTAPVAKNNQELVDDKTNSFDPVLAKKLGADDYGMKSYVMVILKTGPNDASITDKAERSKIFTGHFSNMGDLAKKGLLVLAGPFMDDAEKRGLFIFNVKTIEEAEELVKTDPAVEAGIFVYEMTKYYGSAALMQINETHKKIQKIEI